MDKQFLFGEVKAVKATDGHSNGEFEVILSMPTLDRDGEIVAAGAFEPLPESIPFHAFHDFSDPIGRARPYYDGEVLKARGHYASTPRAQEIRALVADGIIGHTSVGFMARPVREEHDGVPTIVKGELLEGSFVSVPANRDAAVLSAKAGIRSSEEGWRHIQSAHDVLIELGAVCGKTVPSSATETKTAIAAHGTATSDATWDGPANEARLSTDAGASTYRQAFAWRDPDGDVDTKATYKFIHHEVGDNSRVGAANTTACTTGIGVLNGGRGGTSIPDADRRGVYNHLARHLRDADREPPELRSVEGGEDKSSVTDPEQAAAPAAASPADVTVGMARLAAMRARAELLLFD